MEHAGEVAMWEEAFVLLQCPITKQRLEQARPALIDHANRMIRRRQLTNRLGGVVDPPMDGGLVDQTGKWLYPVRNAVVCLLADEAIPLEQFESEEVETDA